MNPDATRRRFIAGLAAAGFGSLGTRLVLADAQGGRHVAGYGPLVEDPRNLIDLPAGFSYRIVSSSGQTMDDGFVVPGLPDGMGAFDGPDGTTILVRNHELHHRSRSTAFRALGQPISREVLERIYDPSIGRGGTTTVVYDTRRRATVRQHLSLAGTLRNCAGGVTPHRSWISCEEAVVSAGAGGALRAHGYCFEVPADAPGLVEPVPIHGMGRFNHEAIGVDPLSGAVYLTEDRPDGLFYRFVPKDRRRFAAGGILQALVIDGRPGVDTSNRTAGRQIAVRERHRVHWIDLKETDSPKDDLRLRGRGGGAAIFARGEGIAVEAGDPGAAPRVWFACTSGGPRGVGQLWCLHPSADGFDQVELFLEPASAKLMNGADNLAMAPWGDLLICEDNRGVQRVLGVDEAGGVYVIAANARRDGEFAGACFSADGATMFVNLQNSGLTLDIQGPWRG